MTDMYIIATYPFCHISWAMGMNIIPKSLEDFLG